MKTIYLAGGCFWGTQRFFDQFPGVISTQVGYANGRTESPTYEDVKYRNTGHAETVKIDFDESVITLKELLDYYFLTIDPLSVNRQGEDVGTQYRTGVYYTDAKLLPEILRCMDAESAKVGAPLAVEVLPLDNFYAAEDYHQDYLVKNPGGYCHIPDRLLHLTEGK
jgi:methionine-S-sulfoxide reductase